MPALEAGVQAPEIELQYLDGRKFSLKEERKKGPVVAVFFKVSCPVCQMALPYLDRIYKAYAKSKAFTFVGVSQDNAADTKAFNPQYNISFSVIADVVLPVKCLGVRPTRSDTPTKVKALLLA